MNARTRSILVFSSCLPALAAPALAQSTYHISPTGLDTNSGSAAAPFLTIQRAANIANPGDTVLVAPGTYAGFNVGRSGTPSLPITFRAQPGAIITTPASTFNGTAHKARINLDTVSWIIIDGFEVVGTNDLRDSKAGVRIVAPANTTEGHITIRNCNLHHHGQWGLLAGHVQSLTIENNLAHHSHQQHGIYLSNSGDNHIVRSNTSYMNAQQGFHFNGDLSQGGDGVMSNLLIESNIAHDNAIGGTYINTSGVTQTSAPGGSAINCDGVQSSTIRNNLLYNNHASGISLYRIDGGQSSTGNLVVNNTVINGTPPSDSGARWCLNISDASTGNIAFNNIFLNYHPSRGSIILTTDSRPGFVSDYNILMDRIDSGSGVGTLAAWRTLTGNDTHSFIVPQAQWPALFVNPAAADYRLSPASLAADVGIASLAARNAPTLDILNTPRPQGPAFDLGAFERPASPACAGDFNGISGVTVQDIFDFLAAWFALSPAADFNAVNGITVQDIFDFLAAWFTLCP